MPRRGETVAPAGNTNPGPLSTEQHLRLDDALRLPRLSPLSFGLPTEQRLRLDDALPNEPSGTLRTVRVAPSPLWRGAPTAPAR